MAMAVQRLHPGARTTIGPWIERGFYYDFDTATPLTDADLPAIKKEMQKIIKSRLPFVREEVGAADAAARVAAAGEPYKAEILEGILAKDPGEREGRGLGVVVDGLGWRGRCVCCGLGGRGRGTADRPPPTAHAHRPTSTPPTTPDAPITIYHIGEPGAAGSWWDLCAGPHVESTGSINPAAIDLESVAGAYWRGDETKAQAGTGGLGWVGWVGGRARG